MSNSVLIPLVQRCYDLTIQTCWYTCTG